MPDNDKKQDQTEQQNLELQNPKNEPQAKQKAEADIQEKERLEKERMERERIEKARLEQQRKEKERLEQEEKDKEKKKKRNKVTKVLTNTQEVLLGTVSPFFRINIWIIFAVFIAASLWIAFGQIEDVVRVTGFVRPEENVSTVMNIIDGDVKDVFYYPGAYVQKDEVLMVIDSSALEKRLGASQVAYERALAQLEGNRYLQESIASQQNLVPANLAESRARFESFQAQKNLLEAEVQSARRRLDSELELFPVATTEEQIRSYREQLSITQLQLRKYLLDFEYGLEEQLESLNSQIANLESDIANTQRAIDNSSLTAPVSGTVQITTRVNQGDFVPSGQEILKIVPEEQGGLRGEFQVPATQAGKLQSGMDLKIRVPSLPFHQYGGMVSTVESISPDVNVSSNGQASFVLYSSLPEIELTDRQGRSVQLKIGLQLDGRIVLKRLLLWQFILEKLNIDSW
jgi:multidrug resistance efflux pump